MATIQGIDTFYHQVASTAGGLYDATFGTPGFDTTTVFGLDPCSLVIDTTTPEAVRHNYTGSPATVFSAFRFMIPALPPADRTFWTCSNGTTNGTLTITSSGTTYTHIGAGGSVTGSTVLSAGTWYWFELIFDVSTNPWSLTWRINGAAAEGTSTLATTASTAAYNQLGEPGSNAPANWHYSCWVWGTSTGLTDWPGEYVARAVSPASVGTHNLDAATSTFFFKNAGSNVAITSTETDSYTYIDDVPLSAGTDYDTIQGNTPTNTWYIEHKYTPLVVSKDPSAVRAIDTIRNVSGTQANVIGSKVTDDGGTSLTNIYSALSVGSASNLYKVVTMTSKPSTGSWTLTALNALRHRWGYSSDANPSIEIQSAMLEAVFPRNAWTAGGTGSVAGTSATGTTQAVTLSAAVSVGDLIFVCVNHDTAGGTAPSTSDAVTDSLGNTYTRLAGKDDTTHFQGMSTHYSIVTHAGTPTITATFAATCVWRSMAAGAWSNSAGTISLDQNGAMNNATASSGTCTATSITPSVNNALVFGAWCGVSAAGAWSPGSGYAVDVNVGSTAADLIEFVVQGTAAAIAPTATNNASAVYIGQAVSFKAVSGTTFSQTLSASSATTATMTRSVGKIVTATSTTTSSITKSVGKFLTGSSTSTPTVTKSVGKPLSASVTTGASLLTPIIRVVTLLATVTGTASMVRSVGKNLTATASSAASLTKQISKTLSTSATTTAALIATKTGGAVKQLFRTLLGVGQ